MARGREHFRPRLSQLVPGGRGTRSDADGIDQAESWERRTRETDLSRDDIPHAVMYISSSTGTTVTAGTYTKVLGTTSLKDYYQMDMPVSNRIRWLGINPIHVWVQVNTTATSDTNNTEVYMRLAKNGVTDVDTQINRKIGTAGDIGAMSLGGIFELENKDYLELWVDTGINAVVTFSKMTFIVMAYGRFPIPRAGRAGPENLSEL